MAKLIDFDGHERRRYVRLFKERRKYIRLETRVPVQYRIFNETDRNPLTEWLQGTTENICLTGLRLEALCTDKQLEIFNTQDALIMVEFQLPGTKHKIEAETKVNYIKTEAKIAYLQTEQNGKDKKLVHAGLLFLNISEENKNIISQTIVDKFIKDY